jgi:hypothetical protein
MAHRKQSYGPKRRPVLRISNAIAAVLALWGGWADDSLQNDGAPAVRDQGREEKAAFRPPFP